MDSHSCISSESSVLLCGPSSNQTACFDYFENGTVTFSGSMAVGHSLGAIVNYNGDFGGGITIIGGKTGNITTPIVEQNYGGYWGQFNNLPMKLDRYTFFWLLEIWP